jgi:hypothetical protein
MLPFGSWQLPFQLAAPSNMPLFQLKVQTLLLELQQLPLAVRVSRPNM